MNARRALLVALALLVRPVPLAALEDDERQPLHIEADAVELDERQAQSLYVGNVDVRQGSMRILADEVLVHHRPDRRPSKIVAVGNPARYSQRVEGEPNEVRGRAQRMEYDAERDEIAFIDQAVLTQGQDSFSSDRIVYHRASARVRAGASAQGRERVKIVIHPEPAPGDR